MSTLVTRMKEYRTRLSITQEELANRVGVRRETIIRLEKGKYNPSLKLAMDITKEFGVTVEEVFVFLDDEEEN
ncbi:MAG: helix-turn-helix transcriptional regulator [Ruminococcus sp.]|nr:helix-turn-helix transcriptional regulator [Ruminococcus sp.]